MIPNFVPTVLCKQSRHHHDNGRSAFLALARRVARGDGKVHLHARRQPVKCRLRVQRQQLRQHRITRLIPRNEPEAVRTPRIVAMRIQRLRPSRSRRDREILRHIRPGRVARQVKSKRQPARIVVVQQLADELDMTAARVRQMRQAAIRPASLDAPIGDDDSNNYSDVVQDENATSPYDNLEDKTVTSMLQDMVKHLDAREATILRYRYGLDGGTEKTLEEVGEKFGVTRERVRQIQNLALRKLRKMIEKLEMEKRRNVNSG